MINKKDALQIYIILFLMKLFTNNKTGEPNGFEKKYGKNLSLIIPISKTNDFHIHHWMYLIIILNKFKKNSKIKNFCIAGIIHGLMYKDSLEIIKIHKKNQRYFLSNIKK